MLCYAGVKKSGKNTKYIVTPFCTFYHFFIGLSFFREDVFGYLQFSFRSCFPSLVFPSPTLIISCPLDMHVLMAMSVHNKSHGKTK